MRPGPSAPAQGRAFLSRLSPIARSTTSGPASRVSRHSETRRRSMPRSSYVEVSEAWTLTGRWLGARLPSACPRSISFAMRISAARSSRPCGRRHRRRHRSCRGFRPHRHGGKFPPCFDLRRAASPRLAPSLCGSPRSRWAESPCGRTLRFSFANRIRRRLCEPRPAGQSYPAIPRRIFGNPGLRREGDGLPCRRRSSRHRLPRFPRKVRLDPGLGGFRRTLL